MAGFWRDSFAGGEGEVTSEHLGTEANLLVCFGGVWNGRKGLSATRQGATARVHVSGVLR